MQIINRGFLYSQGIWHSRKRKLRPGIPKGQAWEVLKLGAIGSSVPSMTPWSLILDSRYDILLFESCFQRRTLRGNHCFYNLGAAFLVSIFVLFFGLRSFGICIFFSFLIPDIYRPSMRPIPSSAAVSLQQTRLGWVIIRHFRLQSMYVWLPVLDGSQIYSGPGTFPWPIPRHVGLLCLYWSLSVTTFGRPGFKAFIRNELKLPTFRCRAFKSKHRPGGYTTYGHVWSNPPESLLYSKPSHTTVTSSIHHGMNDTTA